MPANLIMIQLQHPEFPGTTVLNGKSWALCGMISFLEDMTLGLGAEELNLKQKGRHFQDLLPAEDGSYTLELAIELPDRLPHPQDSIDYSWPIKIGDTETLNVCFSNQMLGIRFREGKGNRCVLLPAFSWNHFKKGKDSGIPNQAHIEYLNTVATTQFKIDGRDAHDALMNHIETCLDKFITAIKRTIAAHMMVADSPQWILNPMLERHSVEYFYLILQGKESQGLVSQRLCTNVFKASLVTKPQEQEETEKIQSFARGDVSISDGVLFLNASRSYLEAGTNRFALLLLAVAVEIATSRTVNNMLSDSGCSRTKLDKYRGRDITFGLMLNVLLFASAPKEVEIDRNLIGDMDRIRDLRNILMHYGEFKTNTAEIRRLSDRAREYYDLLTRIELHISKGDGEP